MPIRTLTKMKKWIKKGMMNMRKKQRMLFVLFVVVTSLMGCNKQKGSEGNNNSLDDFEKVVNNVKDNFVYNGYEEIMKDKSVVLALPLEYKKIDEAVDYIALQKLFVYKNVDKGVIILLQITENQNAEDSWNHSLSYSAREYNNPEEGTIVDIPEVEVGAYSFTYKGYNYLSVGLSGGKSEEFQLAATELVGFNNELINFITRDAAE